jgi:hypothetical protein
MSKKSSPESKREALQRMMGQAKLMEIINAAYDNADSCENCKALAAWWELHGSTIPTPEVPGIGRKGR